MKKKNTTLLSLFIASGITIIPFALTAEEPNTDRGSNDQE